MTFDGKSLWQPWQVSILVELGCEILRFRNIVDLVKLGWYSVCFLLMLLASTDETESNLKAFILTICRSHKYYGLVWKSSSPKTGSVSGKKEFWVSHKIEPKDKSYVKHRKHFWDSHKTESRCKGFVKYRKGFWVSHKIEPRQRWKLCKIQKTFLRFT